MTWNLFGLKPFRFGKERDKGITIYLVFVSIWFYCSLSPKLLSPLFFSDPSGAIVGKFFTRKFPKCNKVWYGQKTIMSSLAVFIVTVICLLTFYP